MFMQLFCLKCVKKQNRQLLQNNEMSTKASKYGSYKDVSQHFLYKHSQ